jgi:hypothetical protein
MFRVIGQAFIAALEERLEDKYEAETGRCWLKVSLRALFKWKVKKKSYHQISLGIHLCISQYENGLGVAIELGRRTQNPN